MFIQTLARVLAGKFKLETRYSPSATTFSIGRAPDGHLVVTLSTHMLEICAESEQAMGTMFRGALAHEALGHGYHSDFTEKDRAKEGPFAASLANAFEDVRIEKLAPQRFPGARRILSDMAVVIDQQLHFWTTDLSSWQSCLVIGLLRKYRTDILQQPLDPETTEKTLAAAKTALGVELFAKVDALAEKACRAGSTKETAQYADEIVRLLRTKQAEQQAQQPQAGSQGDGDQSKGDQNHASPKDDSDGGQSASQKGSEPDAGKDSQEPNDVEPSHDDDRQDATDAESSDGKQPTADPQPQPRKEGMAGGKTSEPGEPQGDPSSTRNPSDGLSSFDDQEECDVAVEAALDAASDPGRGYLRGTSVTASPYLDMTRAVEASVAVATPAKSDRLVSRMTAKLGNALRSITEGTEDEEAEMGRLDRTKLPMIATGMTRLAFTEDGRPGRGIDTEVLLVLDASGSMTGLGEPFMRGLLRGSVLALARFAPDVGLSVATFTERAKLLKASGKRVTPRLATALAAAYVVEGGTMWSQSVVTLVPILARSHRHRRILLTVTDGQIDASPDSALMRDLRDQHIECRFVSIGRTLPPGFSGVQCTADREAFADAFCATIIAGMRPEFI